MNEQSKIRLKKMNDQLVARLQESFFVKVYQDQVSEDEDEGTYHYFIFETGGFTKPQDKQFGLRQDVLVRYYSENRDDLDEVAIDIITVLESIGYVFQTSIKVGIQKGETDSYVDEMEFNFIRLVKYGC
jgi:hypothetical protein